MTTLCGGNEGYFNTTIFNFIEMVEGKIFLNYFHFSTITFAYYRDAWNTPVPTTLYPGDGNCLSVVSR